MTRTYTAVLTAAALVTATACSGTDANLGDGQGAVAAAGGAAGTSGGGDGKDAAAQTGGSGVTGGSGTGGCGPNASCGIDSGLGTGGSGTSADSGLAETGGPLSWRTTCGDPVCRVPPVGEDVDSGIVSCSADQKAGGACTATGTECDPHGNCGEKLRCSDHRLDVNCPRSNRAMKQDVRYLGSEDLDRLADEVSKVRLTTYTYRDPSLGSDEHLGFIIEDNPQSPAVYPNQHHVDLYGYTSMAVAALQVQEKQLRAQEQQTADLRRELSTLRDELRAARDSSCRP